MAFIPSIETAQRRINQSRLLYQDALAGVAEGRAQLQAAVDSGALQPGTPEFINARNKLVNSAEAFAETVKLQYEQDLAQLDVARQAAQTGEAQISTPASTTLAPNQSPGAPQPTPIVSADAITPTAVSASNPPDPQVPTTTNTPPPVSSVATAPREANRYTESYNPETGLYDVVEINSGQTVASGLTEQAATLAAQDQAFADDGFGVPAPVATADIYRAPADVPPGAGTGNSALQIAYDEEGNLLPGYTLNEDGTPVFVGGGFVEPATAAQAAADREAAARNRARQQQAVSAQRKQINNGDWRVRLQLAPGSKYLYKAPQPGILQPLSVTDGVIFPYTPTISTAYKANYNSYDLTHSNFRGYFYQNSTVDPVTITGQFTAQDTSEANYLLAVIHFFRSATKMFYGNDAERGAPPPLVYLTGLGEYQFNEHPCLIQNFTYTLPSDVDYVRAGSPGNIGTNLTTNRSRQSVATNGVFGSLNRLAAAFLTKGAIPNTPAPPTLGLARPTYVPTKMEISVTLLPIQSRNQVSKQFSVKEFANGNLIKGGFW